MVKKRLSGFGNPDRIGAKEDKQFIIDASERIKELKEMLNEKK